MRNVNIGFIGGCINNQPGIRREDLYHSVLSRDLSQSGSDHQISLAVYLSYDQLYRQVQRFLSLKDPDIIFLFIRPFPLMPLQKLIIKYDRPDHQTGWGLHPALFDRDADWDRRFSAHQSDKGYRYVKRNKFELRDINLLAGMSLGLHHWAFHYINKQLIRIKALCSHHSIKLCIISTPKNPESILGNKICYQATRSVEKFCAENDLHFLDINKLPLDKFEDDNLHFNMQGHKAVAALIYDELLQYLSGNTIERAISFPDTTGYQRSGSL